MEPVTTLNLAVEQGVRFLAADESLPGTGSKVTYSSTRFWFYFTG